MEPWYKITTPRKEVREGRSFNPDEFAIHLEQVIGKTAPEDYRDPKQFFARTCFTRALREHAGMVLRRLAGETVNTAPVMTLITQFGGGKTHTLTALYHLAASGAKAADYPGIGQLIGQAGLAAVPEARVAAFVGNAWDPKAGRETPWIDIAWQLAGEKGVAELGNSAQTTPPGTEALHRVFKAAHAPVLLLFDEVLNFLNRHRGMADQFHAFIQNLTVATTGATRGAAVISLPRSQVEMTDWDMQWQDKITKVVRRVAKDLIANDEAEISEVVRRRLFEDPQTEEARQTLERARKTAARIYADWCFERRAQLPPECTAVDTSTTQSKARDFLRGRFEACYPFHPATLSVFQRKWQSLSQYQQTRGTLAMLAQWISWAYKDGYAHARRERLLTLGSAPLQVQEFRAVVLGQLGESRLEAAIGVDIAGEQAHARALDADAKGALKDIHRRVATAIFFESSGGQIDKVAHLPELRFALGEPEVETTTVDSAVRALEDRSYYIRTVGSDGFRIGYEPTMKKVVSDRRASLDEESEIRPAMRKLVEEQFRRGASVPVIPFPADGAAIPDNPKLTLVILDPTQEWTGNGVWREQLAQWTRQRGQSPRLYPGALVWCLKKPGRDLRESVELWLAWKRVEREMAEGTLGEARERAESAELHSKVVAAEAAAKDEVWGGYRFAVLAEARESVAEGGDSTRQGGLKVIDLGAGHSSSGETLCGRVITALKSQAILSESVGAGYIERNWPPALKEAGAWPLASLRQSFLNGALTRLLDPDATLRGKIVEFVSKGDFGLASGPQPGGGYERLWYAELLAPDEVAFEPGVFLLTKAKAQAIKNIAEAERFAVRGDGAASARLASGEQDFVESSPSATGGGIRSGELFRPQAGNEEVQTKGGQPEAACPAESTATEARKNYRIVGQVPPELWNRLGTRILPKLRSAGAELHVGVEFQIAVEPHAATAFESDIHQILADLGLTGQVRVE